MKWELDWFENRARLTPDAEAVADAESGKRFTYKEVNRRVIACANWLSKQGIKKGDRVALLSPNHIGYFDLLFACLKTGAIFVPINWRVAPQEINYILQDCKPKIIGFHSHFQKK